MAQEETRKQELKTPWYRKPLLPWSIIIVALALGIGFVSGWTVRGDQEMRTKAAAAEMVTTLTPKKDQK